MSTYIEDIEFVFSEMLRIQATIKERGQKAALAQMRPLEALATIPHPNGLSVICGFAAYRRLYDLADIAITRSEYKGRLAPESVFEKLKSIIVDQFVIQGRDIDEDK